MILFEIVNEDERIELERLKAEQRKREQQLLERYRKKKEERETGE